MPQRVEPQGPPGLFLHAAAVNTPRGALLFLGHSSSGKSTLCRLLEPAFPTVADDAVYVMKKETWLVSRGDARHTAPQPGAWSSLANAALKAGEAQPIRALCRIFGAEEIALEPIPARQLCRYLTDAAFEIEIQRRTLSLSLRAAWFCLLADLARTRPGYRIFFTREERVRSFLASHFKVDKDV